MKNDFSDRISVLIETTMKNLTSMVDVNTIMGTPVKTDDGGYIIPISKVTVAFLTGAGEYGKVKVFTKNEDLPYLGGNGAVLSLKPSGFLVKDSNTVRLISVSNEPYGKLFDIFSDYMQSVKSEEK